jgi:hypothetical protein
VPLDVSAFVAVSAAPVGCPLVEAMAAPVGCALVAAMAAPVGCVFAVPSAAVGCAFVTVPSAAVGRAVGAVAEVAAAVGAPAGGTLDWHALAPRTMTTTTTRRTLRLAGIATERPF